VPIVTKQIREGAHYQYRILAVGERTGEGKLICPVLAFFEVAATRESDDLERLTALLDRTAEQGPIANEQKFKHLTGSEKIYEFRTPRGLRLLCFFDERRVIVCTHGVIKKGQKASMDEIKTAEDWKHRYFDARARNQIFHEPEHDSSS
jgi:hypothetical protein